LFCDLKTDIKYSVGKEHYRPVKEDTERTLEVSNLLCP
jgi:hypothetical protein